MIYQRFMRVPVKKTARFIRAAVSFIGCIRLPATAAGAFFLGEFYGFIAFRALFRLAACLFFIPAVGTNPRGHSITSLLSIFITKTVRIIKLELIGWDVLVVNSRRSFRGNAFRITHNNRL